MPLRQTLIPALWLLSDARNDAGLEQALARLPRGSGMVFRHYHLPEAQRRARFEVLKKAAKLRGHWVVLAADARKARCWGADGVYGDAARLARGPACLRLVTAHSLRELGRARRADAVLLSPVFATRSHSGAKSLGALRFLMLARQSKAPVIALGGMTAKRARHLPVKAWAAIDGLVPQKVPNAHESR